MTRIVLLISFLFFFGRFVYSSIGAWYHHQDKKRRRSQRSPSSPPPASNPLILMPDTPLSAGRDARFRGTIPDEACFAADDL
jgi:hypothetical protein